MMQKGNNIEKDIKISIITVCRNAEETIRNTIKSVIHQSYSSIEYIIIDGKSTDNTMELVKAAAKYFPIKIISENDSGIYDAMNKGLDFVSGDYIQFLNAGDELKDEKVIEDVVAEMKLHHGDIYYGSIIYQYSDGKLETRKYSSICKKRIYYYTGDCINHQSVFASKKCFVNDKFDISYKICADREWMIRMCKKKMQFICMPFIICRYSLDESSASIVQNDLYKIEATRCVKRNFPVGYLLFCMFDFVRGNKFLSKFLHSIYRIVFIRIK